MQSNLDQYLVLLQDLDEESINKLKEQYETLQNTQNENQKWNEVQIKLLKNLIQTYCSNQKISQLQLPDSVWNQIAQLLNKSVIDCKLQIGAKKKIRLLQQQWSKREDEILKEICFQYQSQNKPYKWSDITKELAIKCNQQNLRLSKFVRDRWLNKLNPEIQKGPWNNIEEYQLLKCMLKYGKNWINIAAEMNNQRTESSLKNRYFNILKKMEKKEVSLLQKQDIDKELEKYQINQTDRIEELGQQEIKPKVTNQKQEQFNEQQQKGQLKVVINKQDINNNGMNNIQKKNLKNLEKDQKTHAKNVVKKVLNQYSQDDNLDYNKMKEHYQEVIVQKGDTVELDEEPLSDSENISDVQFAVMGKDSQNLHVFPKSQLKAVMELMKQKKEQKKEVQQSINKIQSLPPPLPKLEPKQSQQQQQQQQQIQTATPLQPQIPVQVPVVQPIMQPVTMPASVIPLQQPIPNQTNQQSQQSQQQQSQQQQQQQQQQQYFQLVYPQNFMYPQVQMAPVAQIPLLPGQIPQMVGQIQGQMPQMVQAMPGQMPQIIQPIPQMMPGQIPQMVPAPQNGQMPQLAQIGQMPQMAQMGQMGQIGQMAQMGQMGQMAQIAQMPQMAQMAQIPMQAMNPQQQVGMPQQFIPIIYAPQPMFQQQQQSSPNQQQKQNGQQMQMQPLQAMQTMQPMQPMQAQQMQMMNYQIPMMPAYGDQYFQYMGQPYQPQKQPKYQVKQEMEDQQSQNRK